MKAIFKKIISFISGYLLSLLSPLSLQNLRRRIQQRIICEFGICQSLQRLLKMQEPIWVWINPGLNNIYPGS